MRTINKIVVHSAATTASMDIGRDEIDVWHRQRGFSQIGYHLVIRRSSPEDRPQIEVGRPIDMMGAHARGHNQDSIGIVLVGGMDANGNAEDNFTAAQKWLLAEILTVLTAIFPDAEVRGHRELEGTHTECPSFDAGAWWDDIQQYA